MRGASQQSTSIIRRGSSLCFFVRRIAFLIVIAGLMWTTSMLVRRFHQFDEAITEEDVRPSTGGAIPTTAKRQMATMTAPNEKQQFSFFSGIIESATTSSLLSLIAKTPAKSSTLVPPTDETDYSDFKRALPNTTIMRRTTTKSVSCTKSVGRRILINYASNCCKISQPDNCRTGLATGGFDLCIMFNDTSIDDEFRKLNQKILSERTGGGYWLWKPYIIMKTLAAMRDDDILFYADSGSHFIENVDAGILCLMENLGMDICLFSDGVLEYRVTKPEAFDLLDVNASDPKYGKTLQLTGAFAAFKKSFRSLRFVGEWLGYGQNYRAISNDLSGSVALPADFVGHRNDQSIVSLLSKRWDLELFPDPSQWGELGQSLNMRQTDRYRLINKTFIQHTRNKS